MTNEQMIRELRAVAEKYKGKHVFTFETNIYLMATDAANRIESLCDELNRQKAEIEKLTINMNAFGLGMKREKERADSARADAVKEFAERLKPILHRNAHVSPFANNLNDVIIDNLVKEFTEGEGK